MLNMPVRNFAPTSYNIFHAYNYYHLKWINIFKKHNSRHCHHGYIATTAIYLPKTITAAQVYPTCLHPHFPFQPTLTTPQLVRDSIYSNVPMYCATHALPSLVRYVQHIVHTNVSTICRSSRTKLCRSSVSINY